jgi:hypothetical protein
VEQDRKQADFLPSPCKKPEKCEIIVDSPPKQCIMKLVCCIC